MNFKECVCARVHINVQPTSTYHTLKPMIIYIYTSKPDMDLAIKYQFIQNIQIYKNTIYIIIIKYLNAIYIKLNTIIEYLPLWFSHIIWTEQFKLQYNNCYEDATQYFHVQHICILQLIIEYRTLLLLSHQSED